jgi:hypothetical protein
VEKRFFILRFIRFLYHIAAVIAFTTGCYLVFELLNRETFVVTGGWIYFNPSAVPTTVYLSGAFVAALFFWSQAEMIAIHISIEENARATALLLSSIVQTKQRKSAAPTVKRVNLWEDG